MPLNTSAADEIKKVTACNTRTKELRDRWDKDFALFILDEEEYKIPKKEGEWEYAPVNSASTDGNRMIDLLSYAQERLKIAVTDEKHKDRKDLAGTEHAAIGLLHLADKINDDDPETSAIRGQSAAFAVLRGWTVSRVFLTEDEDGEGAFPDLKEWDPRNVYWIYGHNRLLWVCNIRYSNPQEILDEYPDWEGYSSTKDVITSGKEELVEAHDIWDCSKKGKPAQEGVAINSEWVKKPEDVKVGGKPLFYIPVRIKAGRSLPLIKGGTTSQADNIKHVGESFLVNTRDILPLESRLLSYKLTRAGQLAKSPRVVEFDGNQSEGKPPEGFEKDPYTKGRTLYLDTSKGQRLADNMIPPNGTEIDSTLGQVMGMRSQGSGLGPVAYGMPPYPDTAQGTDIINHNILDSIKPFKLLVESDRRWQAEELIRQYKMGGFKGQELEGQEFEGYDYRGKCFKARVKPKDIDDNWHFECELVLDLVRDENLHVGMAATEVKSGLLSKQTSRDKHNLCADPDNEQDIIDRERASEVGELALLKTAKELWEEGDDFSKLQAQQIFIKLMGAGGAQTQSQPPGGIEGQPGIMPPEATAGAARTTKAKKITVPGPVKEAARKRGER